LVLGVGVALFRHCPVSLGMFATSFGTCEFFAGFGRCFGKVLLSIRLIIRRHDKRLMQGFKVSNDFGQLLIMRFLSITFEYTGSHRLGRLLGIGLRNLIWGGNLCSKGLNFGDDGSQKLSFDWRN
jgi:hypothetical protein